MPTTNWTIDAAHSGIHFSVRHLVIGAAGHRLARRVQTFPTGRWGVIDTRSRPMGDDSPPGSGPPAPPPAPPLGRGDLKGN